MQEEIWEGWRNSSQLDKSEVIHSEEQKEKSKNEQNPWDLYDTIRCNNMCIMSPRSREGIDTLFEKNSSWKILKDMKLY